MRLIEIESVDSAELKHIIDDNSSGPWVVPGTAAQRLQQAVASTASAAEVLPKRDMA